MLRLLSSRLTVQTLRLSNPPLQKQSLRLLSKKRQKKLGGGGGGGGGGSSVSVRLAFSQYDLEDVDDEDDLGFDSVEIKTNASMKDVTDQFMENFGFDQNDVKSLEYRDANQNWKPFKSPADLKGQKLVFIRHPDNFDANALDADSLDRGMYGEDEDEIDRKFDKETGGIDKDFEELKLSVRIRQMVQMLHDQGYIHSAKTSQLKSKEGKVISTKIFVLKLAENDEELQELLISRVGALKHIVEAIHWQFLWADAATTAQPVRKSEQRLSAGRRAREDDSDSD